MPTATARPVAVIVLAAGEGTRMRSATPKVLHPLAGRTMLGHVLASAEALDPEHLLVVVGHAWTLLPANRLNDHLYDFLYAWHVPAFVFVTGYLSRSFAYTPTRLWQLVRTVAVPYVVFECALALFRIYVGGEKLEDLQTFDAREFAQALLG